MERPCKIHQTKEREPCPLPSAQMKRKPGPPLQTEALHLLKNHLEDRPGRDDHLIDFRITHAEYSGAEDLNVGDVLATSPHYDKITSP